MNYFKMKNLVGIFCLMIIFSCGKQQKTHIKNVGKSAQESVKIQPKSDSVKLEDTVSASKPKVEREDFSEIPPTGTYTYGMVNEEWRGQISPEVFYAQIKGRHIKIINRGILTGGKGSIVDEGTIMRHKSGVWIIAHSPDDVNAEEIGGCTDGPMIIDFKRKVVISC